MLPPHLQPRVGLQGLSLVSHARTLLGIARSRPSPPNRVFPISFPLLYQLVDVLPSCTKTPYYCILMKALFLLAYYGALRAGELCRSGTLSHTLKLEDVLLGQGANGSEVKITLKSYKHSKREANLLLPPHPAPNLCPVTALSEYLKIRPKGSPYLFLGESGKPVQRASLAATLKTAIDRLGRDPAKFNTHSFRAGRATDLAAEGAPEAVIRETGRWHSNAFLNYIRFPSFQLPHPGSCQSSAPPPLFPLP